ncbi:MAG: hypothetical protein Q8N76_01275, partial [Candidatus Omnitrophota bacterium]|nr:hypothetical protein [Candidatus Omnitrophota bacterium]
SQREDAYDPEFLYGYEVGMNNKEPADDGGGLRAKIRLLLKAGWKKRTVLVEAKNPDSHIGVFLRGLVQPNSVNQQEILEALKMLKKKKPSVGAIRRGRLQDAKDLRAELKPVIEKKGIKEVFLRTGVSTYTLRSFLRGSNRGITAPLYQKLRAYLSSL